MAGPMVFLAPGYISMTVAAKRWARLCRMAITCVNESFFNIRTPLYTQKDAPVVLLNILANTFNKAIGASRTQRLCNRYTLRAVPPDFFSKGFCRNSILE